MTHEWAMLVEVPVEVVRGLTTFVAVADESQIEEMLDGPIGCRRCGIPAAHADIDSPCLEGEDGTA